jgi:hypothetical protein
MYVWLNLERIKFYLIKLASDFYFQPSFLLSERSSLFEYQNYFLLRDIWRSKF